MNTILYICVLVFIPTISPVYKDHSHTASFIQRHHLASSISSTGKVTHRLHVTRVVYPSHNLDVVESEIRTGSLPTKDIVICRPSRRICRSCNVGHGDIRNDHTIGRIASRSAVQVILLDIETIDRYILDVYVLIGDVCNIAGGIVVCLDTRTVLAVEDRRVLKYDVGNVVVGFPAYRTDA